MQSVMSQIAFEKKYFIVSFESMENPSWGIELLSNRSVFARGSDVGRFSPGAMDFVRVWWCLGDVHHRQAGFELISGSPTRVTFGPCAGKNENDVTSGPRTPS